MNHNLKFYSDAYCLNDLQIVENVNKRMQQSPKFVWAFLRVFFSFFKCELCVIFEYLNGFEVSQIILFRWLC